MTTAPQSRNPHPVDACARRAHEGALAQLSPDTLARLRRARQAATAGAAEPRRRPLLAPWLAGGAVAATLALAVVLRPGGAPPTAAPATVAAAAPDATGLPLVEADPADVLQEDPGFYVWLGSLDTHAIAME